MERRRYIAIDLKSYYASVECAERGLDPLDANLVVADESRTDKTICLAVSPALKSIGIPGRARLFEAKQKIAEANAQRKIKAPGHKFTGKSIFASELAADPSLEIDYIAAVPRMRYYMEYSRSIVGIYMRYVSFDDILVYSIDEVFIDATDYLPLYKMTAHQFAMTLIRQVLKETRVTATAGIGTNMYLAKVAMDIVAKKMPADADGVRIAELDERGYREKLWCHRPLTDFWHVGRGISRRLERNGIYTMGDIARCSEGGENDFYNEDLLYRLFGVNAEILIDHAWGYEPTVIADCKSYTPESKSLSSGQVLSTPYTFDKARVVIREMADQMSLELVKKGLVTDQVVVYVMYDVENVADPDKAKGYRGEVVRDFYGRPSPKPAHGSRNLGRHTASTGLIVKAVTEIFDETVDRALTVRRLNIAVTRLLTEEEARELTESVPEQTALFAEENDTENEALEKEKRLQKTLVSLREKYGKNAVVKGMNMREGATAIERNGQVGGHRA